MKKWMMYLIAVFLVMGIPTVQGQILKVDFNSTNQDGGPHNQEGWSAYDAGHEVAADFDTKDYDGITVTPAWPNTTANTVQQMIDRGSGNDDQWLNDAGDINLVTDFLGTDTRTANGGNGDWNGTTGTPTYMTLTIGGLAAGGYDWISFHHDTENCFGTFAVWLSTDGGATFTQLADGILTDSSTGGTPDSGDLRNPGPDVYSLPSTYKMSFAANGTDDVVLRFAPYSGAVSAEVHNQIWGINGFVLDFPDKANAPDPVDGETGVALDLSDRLIPGNISWLAPNKPAITEILGYDLYLDPNEAKVMDRDGSCLVAATDLQVTQYDPPDFDFSQTYYWSVDVYYKTTEPNIWVGSTDAPWQFTAIGAAPEVYAGGDIITAMELLPASLAGTITDATDDVTSVEWEIVSYPGDPVSAVRQMIDRGEDTVSVDLDLLRDWIGSDTRTVGDPLILTLSGLPSGTYTWTSYHHDTGNQTGQFDVELKDANGTTIVTDIDITDGDTIVDPNNYTRFTTPIVSDGSDVRFVFSCQPYEDGSESFFLMNGFELTGTGDPLMIDFGQPTTPIQAGYQAYQAEHEVASTFIPQDFTALNSTITISVAWGPYAQGLINASVTKTNDDLYNPTAELTTDTPGTYQVQLTATDIDDMSTSDIVQVYVGADACDAAQNDTATWEGFNYYDRDENCIVDLEDLAVFAVEWLNDRNLKAQVN